MKCVYNSRTDVVVFGLSSEGAELLTSQETLKSVSLVKFVVPYSLIHSLSLYCSVLSANASVIGDLYTITTVTVSPSNTQAQAHTQHTSYTDTHYCHFATIPGVPSAPIRAGV